MTKQERVLKYFHDIRDQYNQEGVSWETMVGHISNEFEVDPNLVHNWIEEELHLIQTKQKFVSRRWVEGSIEWKNEKRDWEAKKRGLCVHCHGTGRLHKNDPRFHPQPDEYKSCSYCRATGRDLDLEARTDEFHRERVAGLTFSQVIREYVQIEKKEYWIAGYQPLTTDERRWFDALAWRLRREFQIGSCGKTYNGIWLRDYEDVMFHWKMRLLRADDKLFRYVWQKPKPKETPEEVETKKAEKRIAAVASYKTKVKYEASSSRKWARRFKILFPK